MNQRWRSVKLGQIADFEGGSQPPKATFVDHPMDGYIRLLQIRDFKSDERAVYIQKSKKNRICKSDDIMIGRYGASVGQILRGKSGAYNVALIKSIPNETIVNKEFFYLYLISDLFQNDLFSVADRSAQAGFSKSDIAQFDVPVPTLREQQRIVAVLNEAFEAIGTAMENAKKNLGNTRELFESYLNSFFAKRGKGWTEKKLGDIAAFKNGLNFTKGSKGEIINIVGVKDFQKNFYVPSDQLETAQIDGNLSTDYELRAGDILTVRSNGNKQLIGRCMLANEVLEKTSHSGFTIRIRAASTDVLPAYLTHFLKSKASREALIESGDGANISSLNQQALSALPISLPPFSDQLAITKRIQAIEAETKSLETLYQQKLDSLSRLKQAILHKAFAGDLTARSAEAAREAAE